MFLNTYKERAFPHFQIDLKHINQKNDKDYKVEIGIDLREYYPSVEWDILGVPAERHEKYYPCCAEPYPGRKINLSIFIIIFYFTFFIFQIFSLI